MLNYLIMGASDVGLRRSNNEDAYLANSEIGLLAVADGMGGAAAGEVASAIFVRTAGEIFATAPPASADEASTLIRSVFRLARERMISHAAEHPSDLSMGCTAELLVFTANHYILGHVGDSRTYLLREEELQQITKDHSLVQHQVDQGFISRAEAKTHALKNVVLRALGADLELSFDLISGRVFPRDLFLLCSDGLTDMLDDSEIKSTLTSRQSLAGKVELLIEGAKSAGGLDNVTVVLCQAEL